MLNFKHYSLRIRDTGTVKPTARWLAVGMAINIGRYQQINLTELAQEKFQIQTVITQDTMTNVEAALDSTQFVRVHRSYIINLQLLMRVHREARNAFVYLMGVNKTIPIARSKLALLLEYLN